MKDIISVLKGCTEPTILHTDQGSVYASVAYSELIKDTNITRSVSRMGKPTDNPVNESLNGWIKYDTPDNYYRRYQQGELEKKDLFSRRPLTEELKFVRSRRMKDKRNE